MEKRKSHPNIWKARLKEKCSLDHGAYRSQPTIFELKTNNIALHSAQYWQPDNTSITFPSTGNGDSPYTLTISHRGRSVPEDQIFVGLIASLNLFYKKQLDPQQPMPATGVKITFVAGLKHSIVLDPQGGMAVPWGRVDDVVKQMGLLTFNQKLNTEVIVYASANGRRFLEIIISNGDSTSTSVADLVSS